MVVFIKLGIDFFSQGSKEGMNLEMPLLDITTCNYNVNLKFPYYDVERNVLQTKMIIFITINKTFCFTLKQIVIYRNNIILV